VNSLDWREIEITPVTIASLRPHGVRRLLVYCHGKLVHPGEALRRPLAHCTSAWLRMPAITKPKLAPSENKHTAIKSVMAVPLLPPSQQQR